MVETPLDGETITLFEQVMFGASLSITLRGKLHELTLPALSIAVQATFVVVDTAKRVVFESGQSSDRIPEPSDAVTLEAKLTKGSPRLSDGFVVYMKLEGQLMTGLIVSTIVTVNIQELEVEPLLKAVQVTTVDPSPNATGVMLEAAGKHITL